MNNEQQTWILKPGHEILNGKDNDYEWTALVKPGEDVTTGFCSTISTTIWEKHFMPLSVSGLTRQVEESLTFLCQYAYAAGYTTGDDRTVTGKDVDLSVKATALKIVGLLLNQEKETKMRKIEFRAWDGQEMWTGFHILKSDIVVPPAWRKTTCDLEFMQFTGLKDKNGVEIYEGDIVRILYTDWMSKSEDDPRTIDEYLDDIASVGEVVFNPYEGWCAKLGPNRYGDYYDSSLSAGKFGWVKVIGNIYENPELESSAKPSQKRLHQYLKQLKI